MIDRPLALHVEHSPTDIVASWFDRHVGDLHQYVSRRLGASLGDDIVAETFRIALEQFGQFDSERGNERAWLFGIATNLCRRHWRTEHRRLQTQARSVTRSHVSVVGDPLISIDDSLDAGRELARLVDAVDQLSPDDRELLVLIAWQQMTSGEAAEVLGIPGGTVRSRLNRIRTELRDRLTATGSAS